MRRWSFSVIVTLGMISICERAFSQTINTFPWPANPPVGIGTDSSLPGIPLNALHIHYDPTNHPAPSTMPAILRLSEGTATTASTFGILGLIDDTTHTYSSLSTVTLAYDLVLHEHDKGDIIITNFSRTGAVAYASKGAIRFATTGDTLLRSVPPGPHDLERMTIMDNGNIGIDLPPTSTGLDSAVDQLQIGGGATAAAGHATPIPGLTIYGGNRFEGLPRPSGGTYSADDRYISSELSPHERNLLSYETFNYA
jgi:hypothetical protein